MRVHAITLGCQMSAADGSETIAALGREGWQSSPSAEDADVIVLTTCAVRRHAEHRAISLIGRLREWKARRSGRTLIVAGCVAERLGARLSQRFPHIDLVVGARSAERYPEIIAAALRQRFPTASPPRRTNAGAAVSFVTIMRGCSCACSYCVVPAVRGPEVCRSPQEIVSEVAGKLAAGAREITLLGQRVNAYEWLEHGRRIDFADLLRRVDGCAGLRRLRFMSPHPGLYDDRLAAAIRECPSVCEHVHLPAQSGSDRILRAMRRGYAREEFLRTAARLREALDGVVLTTDIIVGFPSETQEDFAQTLTLLEQLKPATAFCFKYSAREGTPAAGLADDVPAAVKEERLAALNALVDRLTSESLRSQIGKVIEVLAETPHFGRSRCGFKVRWERPVEPGSLVAVSIRNATRRTLLGECHVT